MAVDAGRSGKDSQALASSCAGALARIDIHRRRSTTAASATSGCIV
jgi:hypothetical protein